MSGVVEPGGDLDLGQEAFGAEHRAQLAAQDLEGYFAIMLEVGGEVDGGHAAGTELALDAVAFFQSVGETSGVSHSGLEDGVTVPGSPDDLGPDCSGQPHTSTSWPTNRGGGQDGFTRPGGRSLVTAPPVAMSQDAA